MELYSSSSLNPTMVTSDLPKTNGMSGARLLKTTPNSRVAVFDADDDVFYVIQTDISNNKTIDRFRFYPEPEPKPEDIFASKEEIQELKGEINDVQQSIRELTEAVNNAIVSNSSADDAKHDRRTEEFNKKYVSKNKSEQQS